MAKDVTPHELEILKSAVTLSVEGFKFAALANGGAAVALLAYLGNLASKGAPAMPDMRAPMGAFLAGLFLCGIAMAFSYMTQLKLYQEEVRGVSNDDRTHGYYIAGAGLCYGASIIAFGVGSWLAVNRFA